MTNTEFHALDQSLWRSVMRDIWQKWIRNPDNKPYWRSIEQEVMRRQKARRREQVAALVAELLINQPGRSDRSIFELVPDATRRLVKEQRAILGAPLPGRPERRRRPTLVVEAAE